MKIVLGAVTKARGGQPAPGSKRKSRQTPVSYQVMTPEQSADVTKRVARVMAEDGRPEIQQARIAFVWRVNAKPDRDGRVEFGHCSLVPAKIKALWPWDFIISLNLEVWSKASEAQRTGMLDHEISHVGFATVADPKTGEELVKCDEEGTICWRINHHDVEEFQAVAARRGPWSADLANLKKCFVQKKHDFAEPAAEEKGS
jgi:hypothetical protein